MTDESLKEEILINVTSSEVRAALLENGVLQEVYIERSARRGLISNIYKGRVLRVLPGMQAAFIDIGLERTAFLHASDIAGKAPIAEVDDVANILDLVREGDEIMVQVVKDPLGHKGARLTTFITLPSRHIVLLPRSNSVGVSARIEDEAERDRLRTMVEEILAERELDCGAIVRTVAEGVDKATLLADLNYTLRLWEVVKERCSKSAIKTLVHEDLSLPLRVLRDMVTSDIERVLVDSEQDFEAMQEFANTYLPDLGLEIEMYRRRRPIFDLHGIEDEIRRSLERNIPLKSGGYLIFDQTEAMTTVDVNTGGYVGHRNLEETIYRTNLEAAVAIARQLRLRNLGGIIIIDFIDMADEEHRRQLMRALERALERDPVKTSVTEISALGPVEMTRKRTTESLERRLCIPCPQCEGRGTIKSSETVCLEIFREIMRSSRQFEASTLMVLASPHVVERIQDEQSSTVAELEELIGKSIRFQREDQYSQEQYDVVLL